MTTTTAPRSSVLRFTNGPELAAKKFPPRDFLFGKCFALRQLILVHGAPRAGKGMLTLFFGIAAALGAALGPMFDAGPPRTVVIVTQEDTEERLKTRAEGICAGFGVALGDMANLYVLARPTPPLRLDVAAQVDALISALLDIKPHVLILDNLRRFFQGDENDSAAVSILMQQIERLRDATGACVMLIAHEGKGEKSRRMHGIRGSTAIPGYCDSMLEIRRDEDSHVAEVRFHDGRDDEDWRCDFEQERSASGAVLFKQVDTPLSATEADFERKLRSARMVLVDLAKASPTGVLACDLADKLDVSRNTIADYLRKLERRQWARRIPGALGTPHLWLPIGEVTP